MQVRWLLGFWGCGLVLLLAPSVAQSQLTLEISASEPFRARIEGQLVDLQVVVVPTDRPEVDERVLSRGEATLCVFVRAAERFEVGLIDRRASRWLVERAELAGRDASTLAETAALTIRQWVRELIAGGELGVVVPSAPERTDTAPADEDRAELAPSDPPVGRFRVEFGWRVSVDGSDEPSHGPHLAVEIGQVEWAVGMGVAVGLPQAWDLVDATISRLRMTAAMYALWQSRVEFIEFAGRARGGVAAVWRETVETEDSLRAAPSQTLVMPLIGAEFGLGLCPFEWFELRLWLGAEVWLAPPAYRVAGQDPVHPWPVQPTATLVVRIQQGF